MAKTSIEIAQEYLATTENQTELLQQTADNLYDRVADIQALISDNPAKAAAEDMCKMVSEKPAWDETLKDILKELPEELINDIDDADYKLRDLEWDIEKCTYLLERIEQAFEDEF